MPQYVTNSEFLNSPYGADYQPGDSVFTDNLDIDEFLTAISSLIDLYCGRSFAKGTKVDEFDGVSDNVIFLNHIPVVSITSVEVDNGQTTVTVPPSNYRLFKTVGKVKFDRSLNPNNTYLITYEAGHDEVPQPIKQATMMLANIYAQALEAGAVAIPDGGAVTEFRFSKFVERYTDSRQKNTNLEEGIPLTVLAILKRYRYQRM